jgi:hypothetical protein
MDIPILVSALIGLGLYCHHLLNRLRDALDQAESMSEMIISMARELRALGSTNVFIQEIPEEEAP